MSVSPTPQPPLVPPRNPDPTGDGASRKNTGSKVAWQRRLLRLTLALFTFEIGIFLVIFPWTSGWDVNYFQNLTPALQHLWPQPSFRGALTGLGFVNIYLACLQLVHSFRNF